MKESDIDATERAFGIAGALGFESGAGGLPFAKISTPLATAEICLQGAHVTAFQPIGEQPLLWLSSQTPSQRGKAIRGGIPVCWPWFADHPSDATLPAHGIARTAMWQVVAASMTDCGAVRLELSLPRDTVAGANFSPEFSLTLAITVSKELTLELTAINRSDSALKVTEALHTYLQVGDIDAVSCAGLDGIRYRDKVDAMRQKTQAGPLTFAGRTDRIYENTTADVLVRDASLGRTIRVRKSGSATTVVWNPGAELSEQMPDMAVDGYRTMLCVEAANAGETILELQPGESHALATTIGLE